MSEREQVALVTGGSSGIGRAICEGLLAQGRSVVNLDYQAPAWSHPRLVSIQADLTRQDETGHAARRSCWSRLACPACAPAARAASSTWLRARRSASPSASCMAPPRPG